MTTDAQSLADLIADCGGMTIDVPLGSGTAVQRRELSRAHRDLIVAALRQPPAQTLPTEEEIARAIYDAFDFQPGWGADVKPAWVPNGNSHKQNEARRYARAARASLPSEDQ